MRVDSKAALTHMVSDYTLGQNNHCGSHSTLMGASVCVGMLLPEQLVRGSWRHLVSVQDPSQNPRLQPLGGLSALLIHSEPHLGKSCFCKPVFIDFLFSSVF